MTTTAKIVTSEELYHDGPWVETQAGRFYLYHPTFPVVAVAHSLAQMNRYNGHGYFPYSVATHSVLVSLLMEELRLGDPKEGLFHDATEYVIADIASPFKGEMPDYRRIEHTLDQACRAEHGICLEKSEGCKTADWLALFLEADQLLPNKGKDWPDPLGFRGKAYKLRQDGWRIPMIGWQEGRDAFLRRYDELIERDTKLRNPLY